ncbi:hypothetical protein CEXT_152501 [Caerostris extrusa]|uniref:Uncharacterized protein n=1 Tax=Caerostris extrusa TaxID=172846 RepID=A0AAV4VR67_CAEEX|nr:hypothetical protein CEXT_152501 [Caerostris extrusa]
MVEKLPRTSGIGKEVELIGEPSEEEKVVRTTGNSGEGQQDPEDLKGMLEPMKVEQSVAVSQLLFVFHLDC